MRIVLKGLVLSLLGIMALFASHMIQGRKEAKAGPPSLSLANQTKAIEIVGFAVTGDELHIDLKNVSSKGINGFYLSIGEQKEGFVDFVHSEARDRIAPGETFNFKSPILPSEPSPVVEIQSVVFTDNSGDGNPVFLQEIQIERAAEKKQLLLFLDWVGKINADNPENLTSAILQLNQKVLDMPAKQDGKPAPYNSGLHGGREWLRYYLRQFNSANSAANFDVKRNNIKGLESDLKKIAERLEGRLEK